MWQHVGLLSAKQNTNLRLSAQHDLKQIDRLRLSSVRNKLGYKYSLLIDRCSDSICIVFCVQMFIIMLKCAHKLHSTAVRTRNNQQSLDSTKRHSDSRNIKPNTFLLEWTNYNSKDFFQDICFQEISRRFKCQLFILFTLVKN